MSQPACWEQELPPETQACLADLLDLNETIPASARPAALTIQPAPPPAPPPPTAAELLAAAVEGIAGLVPVTIPERPYPVWLRAGTSDPAAALKSLQHPSGGVKIPHRPARILEIGAGAGYRSIALAQAYPWAEILTTEADTAFQRAALLNTLPYRNIACVFTPVSTDSARYAFTGRQGDSGYLTLERDDAGPLPAHPLKTLLHSRGWSVFDTVIITPDAASDHLLRAPWPPSVRLIAVETGGAALHGATAERYPNDKFLTLTAGAYVLLHRRAFDAAPPPPRAIPIFNPEGTPQPLTLADIAAAPPGFFPIGPHGFRLHPNASGAPATLTLTHQAHAYKELLLTLRSALPIANPIRFSVRITAPGTGDQLLSASEILAGGETRSVAIPLPEFTGPCKITFTTEMADFEHSNAGAWAEFLAAAFV